MCMDVDVGGRGRVWRNRGWGNGGVDFASLRTSVHLVIGTRRPTAHGFPVHTVNASPSPHESQTRLTDERRAPLP